MPKKKVAIFGLGKIGIEYDLDFNYKWIPNQIKSHVKAVRESVNFELTYIVDHNTDKLNKMRRIIGDVESGHTNYILTCQAPDLAIISVPTLEHLKVFQSIQVAWPNVTCLIEKPMGNSYPEAKNIFKLMVKNKQRIFVNYFRRYLSNFESLIKSDSFKKRGN